MEMYVAGEWQSSSEASPVIHPYSNATVAEVPVADRSQIEAALAAAVDGAKAMRALSPYDRLSLLYRAADQIDAELDDFARTISLESGKPLSEARAEARRAGELIRLSAAEGARIHGETIPVDSAQGNEGKLAFTLRQPCGVIVAITPFNYPLLLVLHKVAPALASGNAVILKPAEQTPLTAIKLTELMLRAGLPNLAIQCITGPGDIVGRPLCADPRVRMVSFTGSTSVGERIAQIAGVKKLALELGSNSAMVVLRDADIELASSAAATGGYVNAGQVCLSVQRVLVSRDCYADYLDALIPKVERISVGDPFAEDTQMSSLITTKAAERVLQTVNDAIGAGGTLLTGGTRNGAVMSPTVVSEVNSHTDIWTEEVFGPAIGVASVEGVGEAISMINGGKYGLAAGIFTSSVGDAMQFAKSVDVGNAHINAAPLWRADSMPYGGLKSSGLGKEGPRWAIEEMTESKTIVIHG